jgi:hypothetical protein
MHIINRAALLNRTASLPGTPRKNIIQSARKENGGRAADARRGTGCQAARLHWNVTEIGDLNRRQPGVPEVPISPDGRPRSRNLPAWALQCRRSVNLTADTVPSAGSYLKRRARLFPVTHHQPTLQGGAHRFAAIASLFHDRYRTGTNPARRRCDWSHSHSGSSCSGLTARLCCHSHTENKRRRRFQGRCYSYR